MRLRHADGRCTRPDIGRGHSNRCYDCVRRRGVCAHCKPKFGEAIHEPGIAFQQLQTRNLASEVARNRRGWRKSWQPLVCALKLGVRKPHPAHASHKIVRLGRNCRFDLNQKLALSHVRRRVAPALIDDGIKRRVHSENASVVPSATSVQRMSDPCAGNNLHCIETGT